MSLSTSQIPLGDSGQWWLKGYGSGLQGLSPSTAQLPLGPLWGDISFLTPEPQLPNKLVHAKKISLQCCNVYVTKKLFFILFFKTFHFPLVKKTQFNSYYLF